MECIKGLTGIYNWFAKEPLRLRSLSAIDQRCHNLSAPAADLYEARSRFFTPLLRCGVIEFYGAGQFGLAPTCAIRSGRQLLLINGYPELRLALQAEADPIFPGISRAANFSRQIQVFQQYQIPYYEFSLATFWRGLPPPAAVIKQWPLTIIDDLNGFEYFDQQWKPVRGLGGPGVYRRSANAYAERYYKTGEGCWHILPKLSDNIDAFNQAVLLDKIQNQRLMDIVYTPNLARLKIGMFQFPIIAERLLLLHTLLNQGVTDPVDRTYELGAGMLKAFQQYTSNLIQYVE